MQKLSYPTISSRPEEMKPASSFKSLGKHPCPSDQELFDKLEAYRLELEAELKAVKSDYQELYEFGPIGYFDLDENNHIIKVNLSGAQLLGIPRSFLIGKRFSAFVSKSCRLAFHQHVQRVIATTIKQTCELELLKNDDASFPGQLESIAVTELTQDKVRLRVSLTDIGERRLTEQALRSSEEKFRSILETTKEWIWAIDLKGRYLYSNPAVTDILGYTVTEILNCSRLLLIHKDDRFLVTRMLPTLLRSKRGWSNLVCNRSRALIPFF